MNSPVPPDKNRPGGNQVTGNLKLQRDQDEKAALLRILQLESEMRRIPTERELIFHIANESRPVLGYRQAFVFRRKRGWKLEAVSSVSNFDRQAPINIQIVKFVEKLMKASPEGEIVRAKLSDDGQFDDLARHTFENMVLVPLKTRKGKVFAAMALLHERPWPESFYPLAQRVAEAYSHTWESLSGRALERRRGISARVALPLIMAGLLMLGFLRAPLTVLAPAEVTGQHRFAVAAPLDGTIKQVTVEPNELVQTGTILAQFDDTELRNAFEIAEKQAIVAQARLEKLQNSSFVDRDAARQTKVAEAEFVLAKAERDLARERLSRVEIQAVTSGIAVFDNARELTGRPVGVGEQIMEIVSPDRLEFTIRLPVSDNIVLKDGNRVRVFLDSDPLNPIEATLLRGSYRAATQEDGSFAYRLIGRATDEKALERVRIGARGTAQLFGETHSLHFIVFRRPLSWIRQTFGM
ncbi:efflux RND transporter periplasmic adaptor subunit [Arenibacterium sp. CAU 1754]